MRQLPISPRLLGVLKMIEHDPAGHAHPPSAHVFGDRIGRKVCDPKKAWLKACASANVQGCISTTCDTKQAAACSKRAGRSTTCNGCSVTNTKTTSIYLNASVRELSDSMRRFGSGSHVLHDVARATELEPPPVVQQTDAAAAKPMVN